MGDQSKRKKLFTIKAKFFSFVSRCSHVWCRSRRFDCILLVFFRRWGRLVMRNLINQDALLYLVVFQQLWLVHFDPCCFTQWFAPSAVRCRTALLLFCFFDRGHPRFWNFYSTIPFDVVRVKSYMNCFFDSARDPYHYTRETNEKCYHFILVPLCIIIVQRKFFFKIYWMHSCSCKTQALFACCPTDWLEKCLKKYVIFNTIVFF